MNNMLIKYGKIFRAIGLHRCAHIFQPHNNVRVTYTHIIRAGDMMNFDRIVQYFRRTRSIISPEFFFSLYTGDIPFKGRFLLMTFDDALLSNYMAAKEILDPYGIKAIFFVPTAILGLKSEKQMRHFVLENLSYEMCDQASSALDDYHFMTADHLLELSARGHMICPHTHSHMILRNVRDEEAARRELIQPKEILEDLLHKKIHAIAFPVGTERSIGHYAYTFISRNYEFCFTALNGVNSTRTNPLTLHRDCIPAEAPLAYVQMVMDGTYDLYYMQKMFRLKKLVQNRKYNIRER